MRRPMIALATVAACASIGYVFWSQQVDMHEDEEEHHHHENLEDAIVEISKADLAQHGIAIQHVSSVTLKQTILVPVKIILNPDLVVHVLPKISGTVSKAYKNLGENVDAGEILATLESREVAEMKAGYLAAWKRANLTESNFQREKNLFEKKISTAQEYQSAQNAYDEAIIQCELARQKLHALGLNDHEIAQIIQNPGAILRTYDLRSPISGKVLSRHLSTGEAVQAEHIAYIIANLDKVWAEISIPAKDRKDVREGQLLTISTQDGHSIKALIIHLSPVVDEHTRASPAIALIDNRSKKWIPGIYVHGELVKEVINVPIGVEKDAIQTIDGTDVLFIPIDGGFAVRPIIRGRSDEHTCEILSGISLGEAYACKNTFLLKAELKKDEAEHMD